MADHDWANGPAAGDAPVGGEGEWADGGGGGRGGRTPSPRREDSRRDRSRSPARRGDYANGDRGRADSNPGMNLHVSGIAHNATDDDLREFFSKCGRVQSAQVMRDPHTQEVRGFGFVMMEQLEEAEIAISTLNSTELLGKIITIQKARRGRGRTPTPGQYRGPPKPDDRGYRGRYDDRYARDDRYGSRYDDRYDRRRDYYDDRRRDDYYDRRDRYDDRDRYSRRDDDRYARDDDRRRYY